MKPKRFAPRTRVVVILIAFAAIGYTTYLTFLAPEWHLTALRFNPFAVISAITVALNISLLIYFLLNVARTEERMWLSVYLMGLSVFSICEMMQRLSATPEGALFWGGMSGVSLIAAPAIYLFSLTYTNQSERRYNGVVIALLFSGVIFFFYECFTNIVFINSTKYAMVAPWGFDYRTAIGPASSALLLWYDVLLLCALLRLISFRRHTHNSLLRKQSLLFIFAVSLPLIGGTTTDLIMPIVGFTGIPSLGVTFGTPAAFLIIYGLRRYQLLTVNPTLFSNTILSIMKESVVVTDEHFDIIFTNAQADALLGFTEDQSKKSLLHLVARDSLPTFEQAFAGEPDNEALTIDRVDIAPAHDSHIPVRITSTRLRVGEYKTRVMILADITQELHTRGIIEHEVKVRTEELNEARAYLVSSINSLVQGFALVDGHANVVLVNGVVTKLLGASKDNLAGKPFADATKVLQWNADLGATVTKVIEEKHHKHFEAAATDGSFYQVYATPVLAGERAIGAVVLVQDVTEQKILDRSKDEFFSIASHELRTPLTAIRGNMSMVKDYFPDVMKDESLAAMVDDTHAASIRLIEIVSDFLDSSKLEQGKMVFNLAPVEVKPTVEAVARDLAPILKAHENTVKFDASLDKLPKVNVDEGRYRQIVYNLLSNATKYSQASTITVTADHDAHSVTLHVTDTGKGISPENQKLLFHKFQQASDPLTRDDTKGTGLGLYISKLLATHMKGDVFLEHTEEGKGSMFGVRVGRAA